MNKLNLARRSFYVIAAAVVTWFAIERGGFYGILPLTVFLILMPITEWYCLWVDKKAAALDAHTRRIAWETERIENGGDKWDACSYCLTELPEDAFMKDDRGVLTCSECSPEAKAAERAGE